MCIKMYQWIVFVYKLFASSQYYKNHKNCLGCDNWLLESSGSNLTLKQGPSMDVLGPWLLVNAKPYEYNIYMNISYTYSSQWNMSS